MTTSQPRPTDPQERLQRVQQLEREIERLEPEETRLSHLSWELHQRGQSLSPDQLQEYNQVKKQILKLLEEMHGYEEFAS